LMLLDGEEKARIKRRNNMISFTPLSHVHKIYKNLDHTSCKLGPLCIAYKKHSWLTLERRLHYLLPKIIAELLIGHAVLVMILDIALDIHTLLGKMK